MRYYQAMLAAQANARQNPYALNNMLAPSVTPFLGAYYQKPAPKPVTGNVCKYCGGGNVDRTHRCFGCGAPQ